MKDTPSPRKAPWRWLWAVGVAVALGLGLVLLFLLTLAADNQALYERNYDALLWLNAGVAAVLLVVIAWTFSRLVIRWRRGKFGSRLLAKLAMIFALVGMLPGVLIYGVSYQFVSRSIESWFDVQVEGALEAGLNLGRTSLDTLASDLSSKARVAAGQISDIPSASAGLALERLRDQLGADDIILWSPSGQPLASAGASLFQLNPERPASAQLRQLRSQGVISQLAGLEDGVAGKSQRARVKVLAIVAAPGLGLLDENRILQVTQTLPPNLVANALAVELAYREYQERALARQGLRRMYIGTLTLTLFLAVFGAVLLAVLLGNQLARPLLLLAQGVRDVAAGDLSPKAVFESRDELSDLTRSFAQMTAQLAQARNALGESMAQVDLARANLQTILDNMSAGVIVMDEMGLVLSSNPGATRILRVPLAAFEGKPLGDAPGLQGLAEQVDHEFAGFVGERSQHGLDHWQQSFELASTAAAMPSQGPSAGHNGVTLVARGAVLPNQARLLVFDDISEIVSAQRAQAWGDVARRLAHEIKNPLTPIQLSAERLEMKLTGKLPDGEQAILVKSIKTIVDQVDAMKRLVNEFRDYARLPVADLKPLDFNALVLEVLSLYGEETAAVPVHADLDEQCPRVMGDALQLRQVIHNLLQNAQDATHSERAHLGVILRTQWVASSGRVRLTVMDHGSGFPEHILQRAFEPYITTKPRGTGLGLAVVRKIADEHGARIDLRNRDIDGVVQGAQVSLSFEAETPHQHII